MNANKGYESLAGVLQRALDQAQNGKGAERHANELPFDRQPMQTIAGQVGVGFLIGQAIKKAQESQCLPAGRDVAELLGAINYLAGAVMFLERGEAPEPANDNAALPEGFLPWDPYSVGNPPANGTVDKAVRRDGKVIGGHSANHWDPMRDAPEFEIVGYKLHG